MMFTGALFIPVLLFYILVYYYSAVKYRATILALGSLLFLFSINLASVLLFPVMCLFNFLVAHHLARTRSVFLLRSSILLNILCMMAAGSWMKQNAFGFDGAQIVYIAGTSFYGLQFIAYLLDVYGQKVQPESNIVLFFAGNGFFPRILSGPVIPYQEFRPQLHLQRPTGEMVLAGLQRLILGLFKKLVVAERLAPTVADVFDSGQSFAGVTVLAAAILFTLQLYFDFSAYVDLAIAVSFFLGIRLSENFDFPFASTSVTMFWRRWHISLIRFFTTYIFYPLSYRLRRRGLAGTSLAIIVTFLVSALWHGLALTFLFWGICHMVYLIVELLVDSNRGNPVTSGLARFLHAGRVMLLVSLAHIFFRSGSINQAFELFSSFAQGSMLPQDWFVDFFVPLARSGHQQETFNFILTVSMMGFGFFAEWQILKAQFTFQPVMIFSLILLLLMCGVFAANSQFIYSRF